MLLLHLVIISLVTGVCAGTTKLSFELQRESIATILLEII